MTTATATRARASSDVLAIALVALMGAALLFTAGFANSATLHDSTHDSRHAIGFPCH